MPNNEDFESVRIRLFSPRAKSLLSFGEVSSPETFNPRTGAPVKNGLFCESIFGPTRSGRCSCGAENGPGGATTCRACGCKLIDPEERRKRIGHITLARPVVHVWYYKGRKALSQG